MEKTKTQEQLCQKHERLDQEEEDGVKGWICTRCTLMNNIDSVECAVCEMRRRPTLRSRSSSSPSPGLSAPPEDGQINENVEKNEKDNSSISSMVARPQNRKNLLGLEISNNHISSKKKKVEKEEASNKKDHNGNRSIIINPPPEVIGPSWSCSTCTLLNSCHATECAACGIRCPPPSRSKTRMLRAARRRATTTSALRRGVTCCLPPSTLQHDANCDNHVLLEQQRHHHLSAKTTANGEESFNMEAVIPWDNLVQWLTQVRRGLKEVEPIKVSSSSASVLSHEDNFHVNEDKENHQGSSNSSFSNNDDDDDESKILLSSDCSITKRTCQQKQQTLSSLSSTSILKQCQKHAPQNASFVSMMSSLLSDLVVSSVSSSLALTPSDTDGDDDDIQLSYNLKEEIKSTWDAYFFTITLNVGENTKTGIHNNKNNHFLKTNMPYDSLFDEVQTSCKVGECVENKQGYWWTYVSSVCNLDERIVAQHMLKNLGFPEEEIKFISRGLVENCSHHHHNPSDAILEGGMHNKNNRYNKSSSSHSRNKIKRRGPWKHGQFFVTGPDQYSACQTHKDDTSSILLVIRGKKDVRIADQNVKVTKCPENDHFALDEPVWEEPFPRGEEDMMMIIDNTNNNIKRQSSTSRSRTATEWQAFELKSGDALVIPSGWWHQVRSEPGTIALSLSLFLGKT
mmetsp:Transcript_9953/g.14732  ORF Transcript_9953/g.14732 Transcript_9953/m.14732 type:complete len:683 (+) Transcript_9953:97-2145(+)